MSIEIRTRVLKNGSQSLYLDCYENGKRNMSHCICTLFQR